MAEFNIYYSSAFNISAAGRHVYLYSPELEVGIGLGGIPVNPTYKPYIKVPGGLTTAQFGSITHNSGFITGLWNYEIYNIDCHSVLIDAFNEAGKRYPNKARKIERIDFRDTFAGDDSIMAAFRDFTMKTFAPKAFNARQCRMEVGRLVLDYAKAHHRFKSRTGNLVNSGQVRELDSALTEIFFDAKYTEYVENITNENFLWNAVRANENRIANIYFKQYEQAMQSSLYDTEKVVQELGELIIRKHMKEILGVK